MKGIRCPDPLSAPVSFKIFAFAFISVTLFFLLFGSNWSESDGYLKLPKLFYRKIPISSPPSISISPNAEENLDISSSQSNHTNGTVSGTALLPSSLTSSPSPEISTLTPFAPLPPSIPEHLGILDRNGKMRDDFDVGAFGTDVDLVDDWEDDITNRTEDVDVDRRDSMGSFPLCPESMMEYIPCMDDAKRIQKLKSTDRGEKYERHCPGEGEGLSCLVPSPKNYKTPIPWPRSRDEVWYNNVPHPHLAENKEGRSWIAIDNKFKFPGDRTQFIHGADQYLDQISQMSPDIQFGKHTRVILDVDCGVASFGAFLLSRNAIVLSIAPKVNHENQIQFALERGVPSMVAAFATRRLLYPSQAFDLIHCSRCGINWTRHDGILLLEVNRLLRAGGFFVWAAQPFYKHGEIQQKAWKEMVNLTSRICWELVKQEGYIAIWKKPLNNSCYVNRNAAAKPPLCDKGDDPDSVWYVDMKPCITQLMDNRYGSNVTNWPLRLHSLPYSLQFVNLDADIAKEEHFKAESLYWNGIIPSFIRGHHWKALKLRNVMDMRAGFGGFAAAIIDQHMDAWVMNVVPISGPNTLSIIYDRGLIGVIHDWCEPFDTYPRTYDLLHASGLFSVERKRCNISSIMLEMDRILRPGGHAYIRDSSSVIEDIQKIALALGWRTSLHETSEGRYDYQRVLTAEKVLLHA